MEQREQGIVFGDLGTEIKKTAEKGNSDGEEMASHWRLCSQEAAARVEPGIRRGVPFLWPGNDSLLPRVGWDPPFRSSSGQHFVGALVDCLAPSAFGSWPQDNGSTPLHFQPHGGEFFAPAGEVCSTHAPDTQPLLAPAAIIGSADCPLAWGKGGIYEAQVLIPAIHIQATGSRGCCGNRCGMFLSVLLAGVGAFGAAYAVVVSMLGLAHGPRCQYLQNGTHLDWGRPFEHSESLSKDSYLLNKEMWDICKDPPGIVPFNLILFSLILGAGLAELGLCLLQIFNGLFGCVCGTCREEKTLETYN